jgi:diguanylate cyclase (GGDEF)-like protein
MKFDSLPRRAWRELLRQTTPRSYSQGQAIFTEGEEASTVLWLRQGRVELFKSFFGERHRLTLLSRGSLLGESELFEEEGARSLSALADSDCLLYELPNGRAREFLLRFPQMGLAMLAHFTRRDREIEQNLLEQLVHRHLELQLHSTRLESKARRRLRDLEQSNEDLHRLAWLDPLTGAHNRRGLESVLGQACRENLPLTVAMMDVDNFKHYNDRNGHPAGDKALQTLVRLIGRRLRSDDTLARYGGEEFCLVLRHLQPEEAVSVCERLRRAVAEFAFPHEKNQPLGDFTISLGLAHYGPDGREPGELIACADARLYQAKNQGRNRLVAGEHASV